MSRTEALRINSSSPTVLVDDHYCEVIKDKPFQLLLENNFAFELTQMTHALGVRQKTEFTKHTKQYVAYIPTLTAIDKALEFLHPEEWNQDLLLLELEKVFIIHNYITQKYMN